jgi:hypothetical protein
LIQTGYGKLSKGDYGNTDFNLKERITPVKTSQGTRYLHKFSFRKGTKVDVKVKRKLGARLGGVLMHEYMCHAYQMVKYRSGQTMTILSLFKNNYHWSDQNKLQKYFAGLESKYRQVWGRLPARHPLRQHPKTGKQMITPQTVADKIKWWVMQYRR